MKTNIVYLDLFSGTGGFAKGFLSAGYTFKEHYFSETDQTAIGNYKYNFKNAKALGDIKKIKGDKIQRPNLITFGSPCQDISIARKGKGLNGKRSNLFFEAVRIIRECQPDTFIFENVKNLFSSNQGKDFETILKTFANLGLYDCEWQLLNTRWVLPQNRERVYFVGHLRNKCRQQVFPIGQSAGILEAGSKARSSSPVIATAITNTYHKGVHGRGETYITTLSVPEATKKGFSTASEGDSIKLSYITTNKMRSRVGKGIAATLTSQPQYTIKQGYVRRLIPLEWERLQGFPDNWTKFGVFDGEIKEISDTQRYILLGNAVTVALVKLIAKRLTK